MARKRKFNRKSTPMPVEKQPGQQSKGMDEFDLQAMGESFAINKAGAARRVFRAVSKVANRAA